MLCLLAPSEADGCQNENHAHSDTFDEIRSLLEPVLNWTQLLSLASL